MPFTNSVSSHSLQLSSPSSSSSPFTQNTLQFYCFTPPWLPPYKAPTTRISYVSSRPRRKEGQRSEEREALELVREIMRSFSEKEPLVKTLNTYVKMVRSEHCFLLFEELGKSDKWLQCLEDIVHEALNREAKQTAESFSPSCPVPR